MTGIQKKAVLLLFTLIIPHAAITQTTVLDRSKCRQLAIEHSKQLRQSENKEKQALLKERIAKTGFLPEFSASGLYYYSPHEFEYSLGLGTLLGMEGNLREMMDKDLPDAALSIGMEGVTMAGVEAEQAVYLGGRVRTAVNMAETGAGIAGLNVEMHISEVITVADSAWFNYLSAKEAKSAALQYEKTLEELVQATRESVEEGLATRNDLLKAKVKRNEASLKVQKAGSGVELAEMFLCRVTGLPLHTEITTEKSQLPEEVDYSILQKNEQSPENRPEYKMLEKAVDLEKYEEKMARAEMLPEVGIKASYNHMRGVDIGGHKTDDLVFSVMGSVKIPIFNWGERQNRLAKANLETEAAQIEKEDTRELMQLEIAEARLTFENARKRLELTGKALEQSKENMETSKDMYNEGKETIVELLEAKAHWKSAKSKHINARTNVLLSKTLYKKTLGILTTK